MTTAKIIAVGNSLGIVLPREVLQRLRVDKGDLLHLVETRSGVELLPYEPGLVAQVEALERTARAERDVLLGLAARASMPGRARVPVPALAVGTAESARADAAASGAPSGAFDAAAAGASAGDGAETLPEDDDV